jgi:hypothetical protein
LTKAFQKQQSNCWGDFKSKAGKGAVGADAMDGEVKSQADEDVLNFDIPDDILERAANAEQAYTWAYCTHPWYYCPYPQ